MDLSFIRSIAIVPCPQHSSDVNNLPVWKDEIYLFPMGVDLRKENAADLTGAVPCRILFFWCMEQIV